LDAQRLVIGTGAGFTVFDEAVAAGRSDIAPPIAGGGAVGREPAVVPNLGFAAGGDGRERTQQPKRFGEAGHERADP
jgi:hypothetical protein